MAPTPQGNLPIHPVILSGGSGTRLWPVSRLEHPKQLQTLVSARSLLQDTALRLAGVEGFAPLLVVCNEAHRFVIGEQLRELGIAPRALVLEPEGRNTAPAAVVAALLLANDDAGAIMVVLPADHAVADVEAFREAVSSAAEIAQQGRLVTFGSRPQAGRDRLRVHQARPASGAQQRRIQDRALRGKAGCRDGGGVRGLESVPLERWHLRLSRRSLPRGGGRLKPGIVEACRNALASGAQELDFYRLGEAAFKACTADSIDNAVFEHTQAAAVIPVDMGWNDIGSWWALWEIGAKDESGNVLIGDVVSKDTSECYIRSEKALIAALGIRDTVVVETADAVLVAAKDRVQEVRDLVAELARAGRRETSSHRRTYRPWGHYESIESGQGFQVKHLTVQPGAALSLQRHRHRAEHWVVVSGHAKVTRGDEVIMLKENESTYIPLGMAHRLENPGPELLDIIEVQYGDYLGEDDIVRLEDRYGRRSAK